MKLTSINKGTAREINAKTGLTGIDKQPQSGMVTINNLGVVDDAIIDLKHHGGTEQAIYIYFEADYDFWTEELNEAQWPGRFGENLTISGAKSEDINIGDIFEIGEVRLQANSPRIPCNTFAAHMDDPQFPKKFLAADRPGIYCRVLAPGQIEAGMDVRLLPFYAPKISINAMLPGRAERDPDLIAQILKTPVHQKFIEEHSEEHK